MDYSLIKEQFDKVIAYSQDIKNPQTDYLFAEWVKNKQFFFDLFGNNLIYELPDKITFELDADQKKQRLFGFCALLEETYGYSQLSDFVFKQQDGFFNNITVEDYQAWDGKIIKAGTKLVKSFKHFIIDNRSLQDIQSEASRIIQENKIEGTLCFSIHPLDFLSLSENNYNWRSCHALDGEYRCGNLSYMMDNTTFICYLKGQDSAELPNFPTDVTWNGKKWRTLFFLNKKQTLLFAGRSYPFTSTTGLNMAHEEIIKRLDGVWTDWVSSDAGNSFISGIFNFKAAPQVWTQDGFRNIDYIVKNCAYATHFNDLLLSTFYKPYYCFKVQEHGFLSYDDSLVSSETLIEVGHPVNCLQCGELIKGNSEEGSMLCYDCEKENRVDGNWYYCDNCARKTDTKDVTNIDGYWICRRCLEKYWTRCEECGSWARKAEIIYSHIKRKYVCRNCKEKE